MRNASKKVRDPLIEAAARLIAQAESLIITAGAGMGVDSGLPDFRGPQGFWGAYPGLKSKGLRFEEIASPSHFHSDPPLGWGFYGHRLKMYRETTPHAGFNTLLRWGGAKPGGYFVFTSNVDGHFQKAGFDVTRIVECHGSIHHLQCLEPCNDDIWPAFEVQPTIDESECRMTSPLPRCPACQGIARPNILMFGDWGWIESRSAAQQSRFEQWRRHASRPVVVELGAGTAIATARVFGERQHAPVVRINPADPPLLRPDKIQLPMGALEAVKAIAEKIA
jgi:NAD-dependent SIR2 family protein deacetylase